MPILIPTNSPLAIDDFVEAEAPGVINKEAERQRAIREAGRLIRSAGTILRAAGYTLNASVVSAHQPALPEPETPPG